MIHNLTQFLYCSVLTCFVMDYIGLMSSVKQRWNGSQSPGVAGRGHCFDRVMCGGVALEVTKSYKPNMELPRPTIGFEIGMKMVFALLHAHCCTKSIQHGFLVFICL